MKTEVKLITPREAEKMLSRNTSNRNLKERHVSFLSEQMKKGKWLSSGETIKFSDKGVLLDGQHRLTAIVRSGVSVEMLVVTGLKQEVFNVIDTGVARTAADVVNVNGYKYSAQLSSAARFVLLYDSGKLLGKNKSTTNAAILEFVINNPSISECAEDAGFYYSKSRLIPSGAMTGLLFIFKRSNVDKTTQFFDKFTTEINLEEGDPILLLRNKLMQDLLNKRKMTIVQKISLIIIAWNSFVKGGTLKQLRLPGSFPKAL